MLANDGVEDGVFGVAGLYVQWGCATPWGSAGRRRGVQALSALSGNVSIGGAKGDGIAGLAARRRASAAPRLAGIAA
jgi:hypothetical protein